MKLYVQIQDDNGEILAEHEADPCQPSAWTAPAGKPLVGNMPANASDVKNNGTYELFRITFQPTVRVQRPNGWQEPPLSGPNFPQQPPPFGGYGNVSSGPPPFGGMQKSFPYNKAPWGASAPTPPQSNTGYAPNSLQRG